MECPFKLFKAYSGVFFCSDLKMGIRGHPFFLPGSPSPLSLLALTLTHTLALPISFTGVLQDSALMVTRWDKCVYVHADRKCANRHTHAHTHAQTHRNMRTQLWATLFILLCF